MLHSLLNTLLPHRCVLCETILEAERGLCPSCWEKTRFIASPFCHQCGLPLEFDLGEQAVCGLCARGDHEFDRSRAVFVYDDHSKDMILKLKHGDAHHTASVFAQWMIANAQDLISQGDTLIPVPIHWLRLLHRTYNQANLLASEMAKQLPNLKYFPHLLKRRRPTKSQGHLSKQQRFQNVQGSMGIEKKHRHHIKGRTILLIDDVMTSGATLNACAKTLRQAGAQHIYAIILGRVVRN